MRRFAAIVGSGLLVAACATGASPSVAGPTRSPAVSGAASTAPSIPDATPRPTPTPVPVAGCPVGSPITVWELVDSDQQCFAGDDVAVRGWLDVAPPTGFEDLRIEPGWVAYPRGDLFTIWGGVPSVPDQTCAAGDHPCGWLFAHINPGSGVALVGPPRWLIVTGHFQDPAAETCHYVIPDDYTDERPDDRLAVEHCRSMFVLVSVRDAP